ncbi:MAG: two-component system, OmpR family, sensor kinase [Solirubrobacteraceae bacterium]|nr:two-component system, OmpR family, sensor kinase [Solirubrobacteraceae bacterium]
MKRRLLLVVVASVALVLAALTVGFDLVVSGRLDADAGDLARSRAAAALATVRVSGGHVRIDEAADAAAIVDQPVWVFDGVRAIERPRTGTDLDGLAGRLATGVARSAVAPDESARLEAVPVVSGGRRVGAVVAAVSLAPYERSERIARIASAALALLVLAAVIVAARWLLAAGLRPVAWMTRQAADWSARDLDRRFAAGPPRDELGELAETLDGLLDRVATSVRHEQLLTAELSHELRTPLSRLRAQAQLAAGEPGLPENQRAAWAAVLRTADELARTLETLLTAARQEASGRHGTAGALAVARTVAGGLAEAAALRGVAVEVRGPEGLLRVAADPDFAERSLHPLVENACRFAAGSVKVGVEARDGAVHFVVADDGPGLAEDELERVFEPAMRGSAAATAPQGAGLGLSLARRLAHAAGGEIEPAPGPGGRFVLRLPRA